jgi:AraC-like DNA-binding protein
MRLGVKWDMGRISSVPFETRKDRSKDFELLLRMIYLLWDVATVSPFRREAVLQTVRAMVANVQYVKQASDSSTGNNTVSRYQELFQQFKTLVSRHCERERNIPFYAEQLHITPHHLSAVISRASGRSAMYWVNRAVVLRAKVLLHTSGLLTYEIAERLNFANPPAFNNFFKRETGLTPKAYRENALV